MQDAVSPKTILDIGAYDGGASKPYVGPDDKWVWVDNEQWWKYGWGMPKIPDSVEYRVMDIMKYKEPADIVVCSNVLYHMEKPLDFLKHVRSLTKEKLILKTYYHKGDKEEWDYRHGTGHPDPSTAETLWSFPTIPALKKALKDAGFHIKVLETVKDTVTVTCK